VLISPFKIVGRFRKSKYILFDLHLNTYNISKYVAKTMYLDLLKFGTEGVLLLRMH